MTIKIFGRTLVNPFQKDLSNYSGQADNFWSFMSQRFGVDYRSRSKLKAYKNIVFGCVSLIGEAMGGEYEPYLEIKKGDVWERIDHEFIDLLKQPAGPLRPDNPQADSFNAFDLWEATVSLLLLQGDCFWYMGKGVVTGKPRQIVILRADRVGTDIDPKTGQVNGYFIRRSVGDPIPLEVDEVLRFKLFNPEDPYRGKSVVEAAADYIETDEGTAAYTKNFFKNGAGISGVLNIKGEVSKGAFRKFVRAWREKYEGVDNAGKVAVLRDSQASFEKIGLGLDELDMAALRKMSTDDVFMSFKVPPPLLGNIPEGAGFGRANIEALEYNFAKWNVDKKAERFDGVIMFALQRYYGLTVDKYRVCHENIIPSDKEFELKKQQAAVDTWMTRDEIRASEQLPELAKGSGSDKLRAPINSVPLDDSIFSDGATPPASSSSSISSRIKGGLVVKIKSKKAKKALPNMTPEKIERFRLTLMRNQSRYEKQYKKVLDPIFAQQKAEALNNLEAHSSSLTKASGQKLFDDAAYDKLMTDKLQPMLIDLTTTQGAIAMVFAGDEDDEFTTSAKIRSILQRNTKKMASNFNDETLDALNATLAEGIQEGEGIGALKGRVGDVYDQVEGYRQERIARTETLKASNNATVEGYRQTGYVTGKMWVVNPDACDECSEFDGKTIGLDDSYVNQGETYSFTNSDGDTEEKTNDYDDIDEPPLHPNCRCTIAPVAE